MKSYTPRELRNAVLFAVVLTAVAVVAMLDPSCQPRTDIPHSGPSHSLAPRLTTLASDQVTGHCRVARPYE